METLGTWMKQKRGERTQRDLAEAIGCGQSFIALLESDARVPSVEVLDRMCDALSLSSDERSEALTLAAKAGRKREAA